MIDIIFADMKGEVYCPRCKALGRKQPLLFKYEEVRGTGNLYVWCKRCRKEIRIPIEEISLDR